MSESPETPLIDIRDLKKWFPVNTGMLSAKTSHVRAVDGVNLSVNKGETLGIVGESGCGKTSVAMSLLQLQADNAKISSGSIEIK